MGMFSCVGMDKPYRRHDPLNETAFRGLTRQSARLLAYGTFNELVGAAKRPPSGVLPWACLDMPTQILTLRERGLCPCSLQQVERAGIEPATSALQTRRSPS